MPRATRGRALAALGLSASLSSVGACGHGLSYRDVRSSFGARAPDAPASPSADELPACSPGTELVDTSRRDGALTIARRFCADARGSPVGLTLYAYLHDRSVDALAPRELVVWWGAFRDHLPDGPWSFVHEHDQYDTHHAEWWTGTFADGHPVGELRGRCQGQPFAARYDDAGLFDGPWRVEDRDVTFDHGSGAFDWTVVRRGHVAGTCRDGLLEGLVRETRGTMTWELTYVHGTMEGPARALDTRTGRHWEGEAHGGFWTRYRGHQEGSVDCPPRDERGREKTEEVEPECRVEVEPFEALVECDAIEHCTYVRASDSGPVALTADQRRVVSLPTIATNQRCPAPWDRWLFEHIDEVRLTR